MGISVLVCGKALTQEEADGIAKELLWGYRTDSVSVELQEIDGRKELIHKKAIPRV